MSDIQRLKAQMEPHVGLYDDPGDYCWICESRHDDSGCRDLQDAQQQIATAYNRLFPKAQHRRRRK